MTKGEASQFIMRLIASSCRKLVRRLTVAELKRMGYKGQFTPEDIALMNDCLTGWANKIDALLKPAEKPAPAAEAAVAPSLDQPTGEPPK